MVNEQKQLDLEKYHTIVLATIDYLKESLERSFIFDGIDSVAEYYHEQKIQTEKNFEQRRLDRLQKRLISLTKGLLHKVDLNFSTYIKEKTGYEVDIFDDLRKRTEVIITQGKISNQKDLNDVSNALELYKQILNEEEKVKKLEDLIVKHADDQSISKTPNVTVIKKVVKKLDDNTEEVTITESTGPKPKHFEEEVQISPDGKRKVRTTQWADKHHAATYVSVDFPTANGPVYGTSGINPMIKAWWKDNSTIVIETSKEFPANTQYRKISSFDDVVTIEYIEH